MRETTVYNVTTGGRSGMGPVPLTVALLNFDPTLGCDPVTFQPCSDRALSTLKVVTHAHMDIFPFIQNLLPNQPPAFYGFFLEETALGGHVRTWPLSHDIGRLNHIRLGTIFRNLRRCRANLRRTYNVGSTWRA